MKLAKVIGTIVATQKHPSIEDAKILIIQPLDDDQKDVGTPIAAIDTAQAGPGDIVKWVLARESSLALPIPFAPVDAAITGIIDTITQEDVGIKNKKEIFQKE